MRVDVQVATLRTEAQVDNQRHRGIDTGQMENEIPKTCRVRASEEAKEGS